MQVKFKKLDERAVLPSYAKPDDAGLDITAIELTDETDTYIEYNTGLAVEIPAGYFGDIRARSSVSKFDVMLANGAAVIDASYRGPIKLRFKKIARFKQLLQVVKVLVNYLSGKSSKINLNLSCKTFDISQPIAQLIILPYPTITPVLADELTETERGGGGFGHTSATV